MLCVYVVIVHVPREVTLCRVYVLIVHVPGEVSQCCVCLCDQSTHAQCHLPASGRKCATR